jgi:general stress protein 26
MTQDGDQQRLVELIDDIPIAMLTTFGVDGPRSLPMARQEAEASGQMWFITGRDTDHVRAIQHDPRVALTFSARDSWVAVTGRAYVVDDLDKLKELWNTFAEAWLPEGAEDPDATLIRVDVERGEYWDTPGGRIASLVSFAKTKLGGDTFDADHGTVTT